MIATSFAKLALKVSPLDTGVLEVARSVHSIQMDAYKQEAALLGVKAFPPLDRTVQDILENSEMFLGAWVDGTLVGALGYEAPSSAVEFNVSSLVVSPTSQRCGVGRALLKAALDQFNLATVWVSTGAKNFPAIALYKAFGFVEHERKIVGPERLEIVNFIRRCERDG